MRKFSKIIPLVMGMLLFSPMSVYAEEAVTANNGAESHLVSGENSANTSSNAQTNLSHESNSNEDNALNATQPENNSGAATESRQVNPENSQADRVSEPIAQDAQETPVEISVGTFEELENAINNAEDGVLTRITVTTSMDITKAIAIPANKRIILTAMNRKEAVKDWEKIQQPADYAAQGEAKQREVIAEARRRAEEAKKLAAEPLPDPAHDVIVKRAMNYLTGTLFNVYGQLQLGDAHTALYVDGNKQVKTSIDNQGVLFHIAGRGARLILRNGVLMHANNDHGYTAPVKITNSGQFDMMGGRITSNKVYQVKEPLG